MAIDLRGALGIGGIINAALNDLYRQQERQGAEQGRKKKASSKAAKSAATAAARSGASGTLLTRGAVDPSRNLSGKTLLGGG